MPLSSPAVSSASCSATRSRYPSAGDARAGVQLQEERVPRFPGRLLSVRGGQCRGYPDQPFGPGGEAFGGDFTARGGEVPFAEFGPDGLRDELQGALRRGCAQRGQHGDQGE